METKPHPDWGSDLPGAEFEPIRPGAKYEAQRGFVEIRVFAGMKMGNHAAEALSVLVMTV